MDLLSLFLVIVVVNLLDRLFIRGRLKSSIVHVSSTLKGILSVLFILSLGLLFLLLLSREERAIVWQLYPTAIEGLVSHKEM